MNNTIRIAVLAGLCVTAVVMTVGAVRSIAAPEAASTPPAVVSNASVEDKNAEFYLRDCSGYVAVFKGADSKTPIKVTDIETETLNTVDRSKLAQGIPAENKNELLMLLEDFSSQEVDGSRTLSSVSVPFRCFPPFFVLPGTKPACAKRKPKIPRKTLLTDALQF